MYYNIKILVDGMASRTLGTRDIEFQRQENNAKGVISCK